MFIHIIMVTKNNGCDIIRQKQIYMKFAKLSLFGDLVNNDKLILFIRNRNFEFYEGEY